MSSAVRTVGGLTLAMGVLLLVAGIGIMSTLDFIKDEEADDVSGRAFFDALWWSTFWTTAIISAPYLASGVGLIVGQAWARPVALAMVPWTLLLLFPLSTALGIASLAVLQGRDADLWLGQGQ